MADNWPAPDVEKPTDQRKARSLRMLALLNWIEMKDQIHFWLCTTTSAFHLHSAVRYQTLRYWVESSKHSGDIESWTPPQRSSFYSGTLCVGRTITIITSVCKIHCQRSFGRETSVSQTFEQPNTRGHKNSGIEKSCQREVTHSRAVMRRDDRDERWDWEEMPGESWAKDAMREMTSWWHREDLSWDDTEEMDLAGSVGTCS